jgi:hypothetical protein
MVVEAEADMVVDVEAVVEEAMVGVVEAGTAVRTIQTDICNV